MAIDWNKEANSLKDIEDMENLEWWIPTSGQHKVKVLKEGQEYKTTLQDGTELNKVRLEIEITAKRMNYGVTKAKTNNSQWGQLCLIAKNRGTLEGAEFTLVVKGEGKQRDYTILEALPLMKPKEVKI